MKSKKNFVQNMTLATRKELKETQEKFGKRFGVKAAAVSKWETGRSIPDYFIIMKIQKLYFKTQKLSANVGG
jgi:transcriptional regulator with XRE-family HTH domain